MALGRPNQDTGQYGAYLTYNIRLPQNRDFFF